jgi:type IV pilus assembly protein PilC
MPTYSYKALNARGNTIKGNMTTANEIELEEKLRKLGLDLLRSREKLEGSSRLNFLKRGVTMRDLILFCVHMEQLERAGVPILDAIADLRDSSESESLRELVTKIYDSVKGGKLLSETLAEHPRVFSEVFTGLIAAGERTGNMADSFMNLGNHLKWQSEIRRKIKTATRYPIILVFIMTGVISLMMLFVVPQLTDFLKNQGFELPLYSRMLIAVSEAFVNYWYVIFGLPIASFVIMITLYRTSEIAAYRIDQLVLKSPFIGEVIRKIELARFCHFFALTFQSGMDVLECMETAQNVVHNRIMKEAIGYVRQGVSEGNSITSSLQVSSQFPSLVIRMFKVGEESGKMENALKNVNFFYDREVNDSVDAMIELIQPVLTIVMGSLLFWITAAVFGPLYDSFSKMNF